MPEYRIHCLPTVTKSGGDEVLRFLLDGKAHGVSIKINNWQRNLVEGLSPRALDLLEIAATVYGVDASVSRGGETLQQMGAKWHRRFIIEMPTRDMAFWHQENVRASLEELLMFLSDDRYHFEFTEKADKEAERNRFFRFGAETSRRPSRALMFSGGLDSFAGAIEEIIEHRQRVALVSHASASKIAPVQQNLIRTMSERLGASNIHHYPVNVQMAGKSLKEGTHRSRSFLFAALGAITAQALGLDRVSFHENGVVSLNLPILGNILGTRATRTTHPKSLSYFTRFLDLVFGTKMRIDNPSFWKTKTEVVQTINRLGMADQIVHTHSCADVHNRTKQYYHCGRCSQCIDRRFATLAAGLEAEDSGDAYRVDLMTGGRVRSQDRELALAYVRGAEKLMYITPDLLTRAYPVVLDAVANIGEPANTALVRITDLLKRHGRSVSEVMNAELSGKPPEAFPKDSLPRLYGEESRIAMYGSGIGSTTFLSPDPKQVVMEIDEVRRRIFFDRSLEVRGKATFDLLHELAKVYLHAAGLGMNPFDYPVLNARKLAKKLGLASDEAVRQSVNRGRGELGRKFASAGFDEQTGRELIENVPGHGYRLNPDLVEVRVKK